MSSPECLQIRCEREAIGEFADWLANWCERNAVPASVLAALQVAFDDLLTNLVDHAFPDASARQSASMGVRVITPNDFYQKAWR